MREVTACVSVVSRLITSQQQRPTSHSVGLLGRVGVAALRDNFDDKNFAGWLGPHVIGWCGGQGEGKKGQTVLRPTISSQPRARAGIGGHVACDNVGTWYFGHPCCCTETQSISIYRSVPKRASHAVTFPKADPPCCPIVGSNGPLPPTVSQHTNQPPPADLDFSPSSTPSSSPRRGEQTSSPNPKRSSRRNPTASGWDLMWFVPVLKRETSVVEIICVSRAPAPCGCPYRWSEP